MNLAARLAGVAEPGQTLVDAEVVRLAGGHDDIGFRSLGEVSLKGMASPVEVYEARHLLQGDEKATSQELTTGSGFA